MTRSWTAGHGVRAFVGFGLLAFANTVLPAIVFAASYLIIPFPRAAVVVVEALPALVVKLLLPALRLRLRLPVPVPVPVPAGLRPCLLAACWVLAAVVAAATPPNVAPPVRVFVSALASAAAAAADVWVLTRARAYGRPGLAGWGFGSALGGIACALMPFLLTVRLGVFLRSAVGAVYYLAALMLAAYFLVLPRAAVPGPGILGGPAEFSFKPDKGLALLVRDVPLPSPSPSPPPGERLCQRACGRFRFVRPLVRPFVMPLFVAFALQFVAYPGISRAQATTPMFATYTAFNAAYGLAVQLGSLVSRSSLLMVRIQKQRMLLAAMAICTASSLVAALPHANTNTFVIFALGFGIGGAAGALYINVFAKALEQLAHESSDDAEVCIGVICAGETAGALVGSLLGCILESQLCGAGHGTVHRWCSLTR